MSIREQHAQHLTQIADLIDLGHDGSGREPLTILDDEVVGLIQDVNWRQIADLLRADDMDGPGYIWKGNPPEPPRIPRWKFWR